MSHKRFYAGRLLPVALWMSLLFPGIARAQLSEAAAWAASVSNQYRMVPGITYLTANNWEAKLDLYLPRESNGPSPTLVYIHGGGWVGGSKESSVLSLLPYLEMGWAVVNVSIAWRASPWRRQPWRTADAPCA